MQKTWRFNPSRKGRAVQSFREFSNSSYAAETFCAMDKTFLGSAIINCIGGEKIVGFSVESMGDCYGQYIPFKRNLSPNKNEQYKGLDSLIVLDKDDVDAAFLPFILSHEGFHGVQDRQGIQSFLVPMYNKGVFYNPGLYSFSEEKKFVQTFKAMERACDVVALSVAWEMKTQGRNVNLFNELLQNKHTRDMASVIDDAGGWANAQPRSLKKDVIDCCLFWGNLAGLWSVDYNNYLDSAAKQTFRDTSRHISYSDLHGASPAPAIDYAHFCLISESYASRSWDVATGLAAIEKHTYDRRRRQQREKLAAVVHALESVTTEGGNGITYLSFTR